LVVSGEAIFSLVSHLFQRIFTLGKPGRFKAGKTFEQVTQGDRNRKGAKDTKESPACPPIAAPSRQGPS